jgi:kumamolisin
VYALPANYPGRNVPDISFNADPNTGYVIYYTSEPSGVFSILPSVGGTSFVAPQLNGVSALFGQYLDSRIGLLNYPLYQLGFSGQGYAGPHASLRAIPYGDNWFYFGSNGYNLGVGFGTMDVANFARFLANPF